MKKVLAIILFSPLLCLGQENEKGKLSGDTLSLKNGAKFYVGQKMKIGFGAGANKNFEFIYLSPWSIAGPQKLGSAWANHEMLIKSFKFEGTKKTGKSFYIVLGGGNLSPYWCEIASAMETGEVVVAGVNDRQTLAGPAATTSPADELKKLKDLYDSGALTKDEYDSAKKKVIAKM